LKEWHTEIQDGVKYATTNDQKNALKFFKAILAEENAWALEAIFGREWRRHIKEGRGGECWTVKTDGLSDFKDIKTLFKAFVEYRNHKTELIANLQKKLFGLAQAHLKPSRSPQPKRTGSKIPRNMSSNASETVSDECINDCEFCDDANEHFCSQGCFSFQTRGQQIVHFEISTSVNQWIASMPGSHGVLCKELVASVIAHNASETTAAVKHAATYNAAANDAAQLMPKYKFEMRYPTHAALAHTAFRSLLELNIHDYEESPEKQLTVNIHPTKESMNEIVGQRQRSGSCDQTGDYVQDIVPGAWYVAGSPARRRSKRGSTMCNVCEDDAAVVYCNSCVHRSLCDDCSTFVHNKVPAKSHNPTPIADYLAGGGVGEAPGSVERKKKLLVDEYKTYPTDLANETRRKGMLSVACNETTIAGFPDGLNYLCLPIGHLQVLDYIRCTHPDLEIEPAKKPTGTAGGAADQPLTREQMYNSYIDEGLDWMEEKLKTCYTAPFSDMKVMRNSGCNVAVQFLADDPRSSPVHPSTTTPGRNASAIQRSVTTGIVNDYDSATQGPPLNASSRSISPIRSSASTASFQGTINYLDEAGGARETSGISRQLSDESNV
jgi:hypothetical protein